jgi:hypothetical protein
MRANHSPLQLFGLIATASVLASGVYANAALAATTPSTTESNGASASPALAGGSSASETGTRSLVDGTRAAVDSNRTSRAIRSVTTTTTNGELLNPSSGTRASGSVTPRQQLVQVTTPAAPAKLGSPTSPGRPTRVDIAVTPLVGGGNSAGASTSAAVPSPTTPTAAPTDHSPADSAAGTPLATQLSARPAPASRPAATKPAASQPVAAAPPTSVPNAPQSVATPPSATKPVATEPVATEPVATQSLRAQSNQLSPGNRTRTPHQLQTLMTQWLRAEKDQATRPVKPAESSVSPPPSHPSWGLAKGPLGPAAGSPRVLADDAEPESGSAGMAAAQWRPKQSPKPPSVAPPRAATPPPTPQALSPAPPIQTRLPVGGAAAATGGGGGSVAPSVVAEFEALALALATILLVRFSLDRATWRSTLLASRLEHPG